ncbi:MAG: hypothetical protein ACPGRX_00355 [Bdellovibrionales bacterium]
MKLILPSLILCFFLIGTTHVQAQSCGEVADPRAFGEPSQACDIYQRRLEYREKRIALREMMEERRETYGAPHLDYTQQHEQDMKALNDARSDDNDLTSK